MASRKIEMGLIMVIATALWARAMAQSSNCTNVIISMSPCLNYASSDPPAGCCTQLATVVRSRPQCLCDAVNGGGASSLGLSMNRTQALALPDACNVRTPPLNQCKASSSPTGTSGNPSDNGSSDASSSKSATFLFIFFLLFTNLLS